MNANAWASQLGGLILECPDNSGVENPLQGADNSPTLISCPFHCFAAFLFTHPFLLQFYSRVMFAHSTLRWKIINELLNHCRLKSRINTATEAVHNALCSYNTRTCICMSICICTHSCIIRTVTNIIEQPNKNNESKQNRRQVSSFDR